MWAEADSRATFSETLRREFENNTRQPKENIGKWQPKQESTYTLSHGGSGEGRVGDHESEDDEWEPIKLITSPCDSDSG